MWRVGHIRRARGEKAERRKLKRYGSGCYLAQFDCVVGKNARPTIRKSLSKEAIRSREAARITGEWLQTEARLQLFIKRWWGEQVR